MTNRLHVSSFPPCVKPVTQQLQGHYDHDKLEMLHLIIPVRKLVLTAEEQILYCEEEHKVK